MPPRQQAVLSRARKSTRSKRNENILGEPRKKRSNIKSTCWKRPRTNSTTKISRDVSGIPEAAAQANRLRSGLMVFHGGLNQSSRIQQIGLGEPRTAQLHTGVRDGLVSDRDWHGKCATSPVILGLRIPQRQCSRIKCNRAPHYR